MTVLVMPVTAIDLTPEPELSHQDQLLRSMRWAISDCIDDENPAVVEVLEQASAEIIRLRYDLWRLNQKITPG